jgi:hypothetical protein
VHNAQRKEGRHFQLQQPHGQLGSTNGMQGRFIAEQLICVLTLRINARQSCQLTTLHIAGDENSMADIPLQSFGREQKMTFQNRH